MHAGMVVDLDLAQMQAFVAVADHCHFGRAAAQLFLTPQALSKRILRLEARLAQRLFVRTGRRVQCTAYGLQLLPPARELLAAAGTVAQAIQGPERSLRIDVWDIMPAPMQALQRVSEAVPDLTLEVTLRRSLGDAVAALQRGEIDAAFGRVQDLTFPWPDELHHQLALLHPMGITMLTDHPLAQSATVRLTALRDGGLWWPIGDRATEVLGYARRFSEHFDIPIDTSRRGVGAVSPIELLCEDPVKVVMWETSWPAPSAVDVRSPQLEPTPLFPWSLTWRRHDRNHSLRQLVDVISRVGEQESWRSYDRERSWLPEVDAPPIA